MAKSLQRQLDNFREDKHTPSVAAILRLIIKSDSAKHTCTK